MKNSPQIHNQSNQESRNSHETQNFLPLKLVNHRTRQYKGGRVLAYATRFRYWRETEGYSVARIAARLEEKTREFGIDDKYLLNRLYELEQGRFKPPTWLILLLIDTYQIKFPWKEFHE